MSLTETRGCAHDWRVNPHMILTSYPPSQQLVCASCGAKSSRLMPDHKTPSHDPRDWPKAEEAS